MDAIVISTAILSCLVLVINITGNSFVLYLITKKRRTCTDLLLLNLAISDLLFGIFIVPVQITPNFMPPSELYHIKNVVFCKLIGHGNVAWLSSSASVLTMMVLSLERYFAVCRPHSFKRWFSKGNALIFIFVIWVVSIAAIVPLVTDQNCWSFNEEEGKIHSIWLLTFNFSNQVFLAVLSIKITVSLWCKQTAINPTGVREIEERKKKKKVTLCVLAVIATYIVCYIPFCTFYVLKEFDKNGLGEKERVKVGQIAIFFMAVNSALDPYLFAFQNPKMKTLLKKIFLCKHGAPPNQQEVTQDSSMHGL